VNFFEHGMRFIRLHSITPLHVKGDLGCKKIAPKVNGSFSPQRHEEETAKDTKPEIVSVFLAVPASCLRGERTPPPIRTSPQSPAAIRRMPAR
jgi:hypothetical protein